MTQLALAVDADDELWTLDNLPTPEAPYVEVESELIEVRSRFPSSYYTLTGETLPPRIRVRRGIAGTTAASHIQGSTLTPNYGLGGGAGAGGVTVDNQSDPPAEVTTLIAPGADLSTSGTADMSSLQGVQTVRLLGPYRVDFDTAGIDSTGGAALTFGAGGYVQLAALPDACVLLDAWPVVLTPFTGTASMAFAIQPNNDPDTSSDVWSGALRGGNLQYQDTTAPGVLAVGRRGNGTADTAIHYVGVAIAGAALMVYRSSTVATEGSADVYALIAEPA